MITVPLLILIVVQLLVIQPLETERKELSINIQTAGNEMDKLHQQMETIQQVLLISSKIKLNKQLESLEKQISEQKKLLRTLTDNLIPPQQMATVIEKVLQQRGRLKLISLTNLEPQALPEETEDKNINQSMDTLNTDGEKGKIAGKMEEYVQQTLVYRHPLQLKLKGSYFQIMDYLKALEQSGYKFYWEQLDYKVEKYPQAEVMIMLSTLGTEAHWMGASIDE